MAFQIAKYLSARATQGGADAFVEDAITTNLDPSRGYAYQVEKIEFAFASAQVLQNIAAVSEISIALSRDTKLAIPELSDPDCLMKQQAHIHVGAGVQNTNGDPIKGCWSYIPPTGLYIVEPTVYLQLDSTATGLTLDLYARFYYVEVKLTEIEILRLLNNL